jgi:tyrosinase
MADESRPGARKEREDGTVLVSLPFAPEGEARDFARADLIFEGVRHGGMSYEVRVFLNNPDAARRTARDPRNGYAGKFFVFGHGGCFGGDEHCDPVRAAPGPPPPGGAAPYLHPLTPMRRMVTVTAALRRLLDAGEPLRTLTLVPIQHKPARRARGATSGFFRFDRVRLETYR